MRGDDTQRTPEPRDARMIRVCAYVDLALHDVIRVFRRPDIDDVLRRAMVAATGSDRVTVRQAPLERISSCTAHVPLAWTVPAPGGTVRDGKATLDLLVVQSGRVPKTELLVTVWIEDELARPTADWTFRLLDELTDRLPAIAA